VMIILRHCFEQCRSAGPTRHCERSEAIHFAK
jgi:hypothetical protein